MLAAVRCTQNELDFMSRADGPLTRDRIPGLGTETWVKRSDA